MSGAKELNFQGIYHSKSFRSAMKQKTSESFIMQMLCAMVQSETAKFSSPVRAIIDALTMEIAFSLVSRCKGLSMVEHPTWIQ